MVAQETFNCSIVTPEKLAAEVEVMQVVLPAHDGQIGILTGHAPLLCTLGTGLLRYQDLAGKVHYYFVDGGFGHVANNRVSILTEQAISASQISEDQARGELEAAQALPQNTTDELNARAKALQRAWSLMALAQHND